MPDQHATYNLIRHGRLLANTAHHHPAAADNTPDGAALPPDEPDWLVPLSTWLQARDTLRGRANPVAIVLGPDADPAQLLEGDASVIDPRGIAFIAIDFPAYTDGRGYSLAQLLRTHYGWHGELRAVGDVLIDTIHYQARCGFDSFVVKQGHDPQKALRALNTFSHHYQHGYAQPPQPEMAAS